MVVKVFQLNFMTEYLQYHGLTDGQNADPYTDRVQPPTYTLSYTNSKCGCSLYTCSPRL